MPVIVDETPRMNTAIAVAVTAVAVKQGRQQRDEADDVDPEARQVESRERHILCPEHDRHDEVAETGRNGRDEEQPHHDDAVHGEQAVVPELGEDVCLRRQQLEPQHQREDAADEQRQRRDDQEHQPDPLVVVREQPRADRGLVRQVVVGRRGNRRHGFGTAWPLMRRSGTT
jgi:hypothetical protein